MYILAANAAYVEFGMNLLEFVSLSVDPEDDFRDYEISFGV